MCKYSSYLLIGEAQHTNIKLFQIVGSDSIIGKPVVCVMVTTIYLNNQAMRCAIKIYDVMAYHFLTGEFLSVCGQKIVP